MTTGEVAGRRQTLPALLVMASAVLLVCHATADPNAFPGLSAAEPEAQALAPETPMVPQEPPAGPTADDARLLRVAVCVVGQLARTETESKLRNLVVANLGKVEMHVFLLLQTGEPRFTNRPHPACHSAPATLQAAAEAFAAHVNVTAVVQDTEEYEVMASKWPYPERGLKRVRRLQNHILQYISLRSCARQVSKREVEIGKHFDAVLRLRDNSLLLLPFSIHDSLQRLRERVSGDSGTRAVNEGGAMPAGMKDLPVLVKACASWGGYNDKVWAGAPGAWTGLGNGGRAGGDAWRDRMPWRNMGGRSARMARTGPDC